MFYDIRECYQSNKTNKLFYTKKNDDSTHFALMRALVAHVIGAAPCGDAGADPPSKPRRNQNALYQLLGQSLMARDFERQVAEIQIRIAVLNRYTALGIPVTEPVG